MATVARTPDGLSHDEPPSDDGLTSQQRRVLYNLMVRGSIDVPVGMSHDYHVTTELGFAGAMVDEIFASLRGLVETGSVIREEVITPASAHEYGIPRDSPPAANRAQRYRPALTLGVGDPVLAWVVLYDFLEYKEYSVQGDLAGTPAEPYDYTLAGVLGYHKTDTDWLLSFVESGVESGILRTDATCAVVSRPGSKGKSYPALETTVRLTLVV